MTAQRTALVTGAQQGIGREAALALADSGFDVAVNYLSDEQGAAEVAQEVRDRGRRALPIRADVSSVTEIRAMVSRVADAWGRVDVLVNNAGIFPRRAFLEMTEDEWNAVMSVNLTAVAFTSQAAARLMAAQGGGSIINLASSAVRGQPHGSHYAASKGGVVSLTRSLALELAPHGIRVNAVAPGLTDTAQPRSAHDDASMDALISTIPLGRAGRADEMGRVIALFASDTLAHVTGQVFHVNGGSYMP
ncbi:SDR family NAD(P)-dependent oxidoreductase [Microbacterium sp. SLBN-146]|uniref:SDR family NAD(P)-dependent oxidoreductase n=1 Tax=Microbacterium sp. SLBN-146 TaxID=2768457 RepID=UPI00114FC6D0|nr:3-oxoacyl-ACP reductase family protein [Microbacterium sp. SLBN-146]TQJ30732.1 3-oxoacyl-[acyl-carrier-protein] reductase [Microbacterium sp. SLBN-146]